jgi:transposase
MCDVVRDMDVDPRDQRIAELEAENLLLKKKLAEAIARIEEIEKSAHRQAGPFRREEKKKVLPQDQKKPGRKPGHEGFFRQAPEKIDREIDVPLDCCPVCGGSLSDVHTLEQIIEEIEPVRPVAVKLTTRRGHCCGCKKQVRSTHPLQSSDAGGCAKVQLGPRALALAALLNKACGLTMRKTVRVIEQLCGLKITAGGLSQMMDRLARRLNGDYEQLLATLRRQPAVYADETSWWVGGPGHWLWTFTSPAMTVYRVENNRGSDVVIQTLGENFDGILVSDCLASYNRIDCRKHKCIAHHLRAIESAQPSPDNPSEYLNRWKQLFKTATLLWKVRDEISEMDWQQARSNLEKDKDELLDHAGPSPGDAKIRNRLIKHRDHLLRHMEDPRAEPTNNRAERSLRPAVIARKLSCGNKTQSGKTTWQVLNSIAATCHQRGEDLVQFIAPRLALPAVDG